MGKNLWDKSNKLLFFLKTLYKMKHTFTQNGAEMHIYILIKKVSTQKQWNLIACPHLLDYYLIRS